MKQIVTGIVAHVDAGKTTLTEALMYETGAIRTLGRVDNGDAFLDPNTLEKQRGITLFTHQAELTYNDLALTLLDTPGHVDFASQTEQVLIMQFLSFQPPMVFRDTRAHYGIFLHVMISRPLFSLTKKT